MKAATALQKAYCLRGVVQEHAMKYTHDSTFPFHRPKLSRKICFTHSLNYGGLCEEHSTKQATDNFQRRALLKKIMETPKRSMFSFTIANLSNKGILYFLITTGA